MDLRAALEREHSLDLSRRIVRHIGDDADRFAVLMDIVLHGSPLLGQRAAWPLGLIGEARPRLIKPWIPDLLDLLRKPVHEAVHRNIMRTLQFCELPEEHQGRLAGTVFVWIPDVTKPIAARASAITVAVRLVQLHPELGEELRLVLDTALRDQPTAAIRSRARKALKMTSTGRMK